MWGAHALIVRILKDAALLAGYLALQLGSYIVPKGRDVVFFSTFKRAAFSGNLKSTFLSMLAEKPEVAIVWLTNSEACAEEVRKAGGRARLYRSFPFLDVLRARVLVLDNLVPFLGGGRFKTAQLWHGTGFKNIGLLNPERRGVKRWIAAQQYQAYAFVLANSDDDARRKSESFGNARCSVLGAPRNDVLLQGEVRQHALPSKLACLIAEADCVYSYCPTFREGVRESLLSADFWQDLNIRLEAKNSLLLVKAHPSDRLLRVPADLSRIISVGAEISDVQDVLKVTDVLISDYSGIVTDFALLDRPIIFFTYDFSEFMRDSRSFYYDFKATLPGPFVETTDQLVSAMDDLSWFSEPNYRRSFMKFRDRFHYWNDAGSSQRVVGQILEI